MCDVRQCVGPVTLPRDASVLVLQPEEQGVLVRLGNEVRAGEASVCGLSVPTAHVTSLSSH